MASIDRRAAALQFVCLDIAAVVGERPQIRVLADEVVAAKPGCRSEISNQVATAGSECPLDIRTRVDSRVASDNRIGNGCGARLNKDPPTDGGGVERDRRMNNVRDCLRVDSATDVGARVATDGDVGQRCQRGICLNEDSTTNGCHIARQGHTVQVGGSAVLDPAAGVGALPGDATVVDDGNVGQFNGSVVADCSTVDPGVVRQQSSIHDQSGRGVDLNATARVGTRTSTLQGHIRDCQRASTNVKDSAEFSPVNDRVVDPMPDDGDILQDIEVAIGIDVIFRLMTGELEDRRCVQGCVENDCVPAGTRIGQCDGLSQRHFAIVVGLVNPRGDCDRGQLVTPGVLERFADNDIAVNDPGRIFQVPVRVVTSVSGVVIAGGHIRARQCRDGVDQRSARGIGGQIAAIKKDVCIRCQGVLPRCDLTRVGIQVVRPKPQVSQSNRGIFRVRNDLQRTDAGA
ncbi:hypothetical protein RISK_006375 [Rhodopirellula islandica]|uniref:Uncharacterized protein n=1 Tax=Rhodopirellula islandica TaxID=595434 RepID=A0A0J1E889_RHOIS|nr:hypothetical protein RISK_006375 [Rhodopirellula islandica]